MSVRTQKLRSRVALLLTAIGITVLPACHAIYPNDLSFAEDDRSDGTTPGAGDDAGAENYPAVLADAHWIFRIAPQGELPRTTEPRWRHVGLEDLLAQPSARRPDLRNWLNHANAVVAANAAIGMARLNEGEPAERLATTVRAAELPRPLRQAAAEALGAVSHPNAPPLLEELLEQYGAYQSDARSRYLPELHAGLLDAWARHATSASLQPLLSALKSPAAHVRAAALRGWPKSSNSQLPQEVVDRVDDSDPKVRTEALRLVVATKHPESLKLAKGRLADSNFDVRVAAIGAMAQLGGDAAEAELVGLLAHRTSGIRQAAVQGLAEMGAVDHILKAANDETWQVRGEVAAALGSARGAEAQSVAQHLVEDRSPQVAQTIIRTVAEWPVAAAGPVLLSGMASSSFQIRQAAAARLAPRWSAATDFVANSPAKRRAAVLESLHERWANEFPEPSASGTPSPPLSNASLQASPQVERSVRRIAAHDTSSHARSRARDTLLALGADLPAALAPLVREQKIALPDEIYRQMLPTVDKTFAALVGLESEALADRRRAAQLLVRQAHDGPLGELAMMRLADLVMAEEDPLVWRSVQRVLADDASEPAIRIHYAGLSHPDPETRRRACDALGRHGAASHALPLIKALDDPQRVVVVAAVEALGRLERLEDTRPLVRMLASRDTPLVLATATALVELGDASGADALERLAYDREPAIRQASAEVMGRAADRRFVATLVGMLDDQLGVKRAALKSLAQIVGRDIGGGEDETTPNLEVQIQRWRAWFDQSGARENRDS